MDGKSSDVILKEKEIRSAVFVCVTHGNLKIIGNTNLTKEEILRDVHPQNLSVWDSFTLTKAFETEISKPALYSQGERKVSPELSSC